MAETSENKRAWAVAAGVVILLAVLAGQMLLSIRQESITWDEDNHIFAGYMSWKHGEFGLNPEHPPLVKLVSTLPILRMPLAVPELQNRFFKLDAFLGGKDFLFKNDADAMVLRTRAAAAVFAVLLALLAFLATREMFGTGPGFLALGVLAFEPNLLAHGARVTTDVALSCFLFAGVYAFYRYVKRPSALRLVTAGVAAGFALSAKHTGILIFPMLLLLALAEVAGKNEVAGPGVPEAAGRKKRALRLGGALVAIGVMAVAVLWAFYGFRYKARPGGLEINPPLAEFVQQLRPHEAQLLSAFAHWRVLPESYIYGLADVRVMGDFYPTYFFGKVYPHGVWFYFPAAFVIKSTVAFLILLLLAVWAIAKGWLRGRREILFLTIPPILYLWVAMSARINIGLRHILPLYVFLTALIAGGAWALIRRKRVWAYVIGALLVFHAVSSALVFPSYMAYANELWGGPASTYKYLSDSNVDWAQQLKGVKKYLDARGVKNCWFAYFAEGVVDTKYYGIPCKPLISPDTMWVNEEMDIPAEIDGPVLISAGTLSGYEFGSDQLNPYRAFQSMRPAAVIQYAVFVYEGRFAVHRASALSYAQKSRNLRVAGRLEEALAAAQAAAATEPDCIPAQTALGDALRALGRPEEARVAYETALGAANRLEPGVRENWVPGLERKLAGK